MAETDEASVASVVEVEPQPIPSTTGQLQAETAILLTPKDGNGPIKIVKVSKAVLEQIQQARNSKQPLQPALAEALNISAAQAAAGNWVTTAGSSASPSSVVPIQTSAGIVTVESIRGQPASVATAIPVSPVTMQIPMNPVNPKKIMLVTLNGKPLPTPDLPLRIATAQGSPLPARSAAIMSERHRKNIIRAARPGSDSPAGSSSAAASSPQPEKPKFKCDLCDAQYASNQTLRRHKVKMHHQLDQAPNFRLLPCFCGQQRTGLKSFYEHLQKEHDIKVVSRVVRFKNYDSFLIWKEAVEKETKSHYVKRRSWKGNERKVLHYMSCYRSGSYRSKGTGKRPNRPNSQKINATCPAKMIVQAFPDGHVAVDWTETHAGHECDAKPEHLNNEERQKIAELIKRGFDLNQILEQMKMFIEDTERHRLLMPKTIHNAARSFNLRVISSRTRKVGNDQEALQRKKQCIIKDLTELIRMIQNDQHIKVTSDLVCQFKYRFKQLIERADNKQPNRSGSYGQKRVRKAKEQLQQVEQPLGHDQLSVAVNAILDLNQTTFVETM